MDTYLWWCGVALNVTVCLIIVFLILSLFIYPSIQAISLSRVCIKALGKDRTSSRIKIYWWAQKELFLGKSFETIRTNRFEWSDINDWVIYSESEE